MCIRDRVMADVLLTVVGGGDFRYTPVEQRAAQQMGDGGGFAGFGDVQPDAARVDIDHAEDAMTTIGEQDIGGGGVEFPDLVESDDVLSLIHI